MRGISDTPDVVRIHDGIQWRAKQCKSQAFHAAIDIESSDLENSAAPRLGVNALTVSCLGAKRWKC